MLPAKRNKVDISSLSEEEQKLFRLYGKLPTHKNTLMKMQKDRKFFDSGDYALSKAGKAPQNTVGTAIPNPENIPHASSPPATHSAHPNHISVSVSPSNSPTSPAKESSLSHEQIVPELTSEVKSGTSESITPTPAQAPAQVPAQELESAA